MTSDASTRRRVRDALKEAGMELHVANHQSLPKHTWGGSLPDALVVDTVGDGTDPVDLTAVRGHVGMGDIPLIALVGAEDGDQRVLALRAGADDCLSKPVDGRLLASVLKAWNRHGRRRATSAPAAEKVDSDSFRHTLESTATSTAILEGKGRFLFVNRALCDLLGYSEAELKRMTHWQVLHPDDHAMRAEQDATAQPGKDHIQLEQRYIRRNGEVVWVVVSIAFVRSERGELLYEIDQFHDITQRKAAERALRDSEERFRSLTESTSDWVWETDRSGAYTYVSPRVRDILGYEPHEIVGKTPSDLMPADEAPRAGLEVMAHLDSGEPIKQLEKTSLRKDGARVVLETNAVPFFAPDGTLSGYRGVDRDVTERKLSELKARKLEDDLAHVSRLNTMGEMAAGFAHELNQPLTAITNYAVGTLRRLASGRAEPDELKQVLKLIHEQAQRSGAVIRRIRVLVKKEESDRTPIDLNAAIRDAVSLLQSEAVMFNVTLKLDLAETLPPVIGDSVEIQQVALNLARNAFEAMADIDPEKRELRVTTGVTADGRPEVSVSDTGPGIDPEVLPQLFDTFFTTKKTGLGIGLSICRSIVQAHDGTLTVDGSGDAGTTFRFTLPATVIPPDAP